MIERLLAQFGVEKARFRLTWASANEGEKFAGIVKEMVEAIRPLGPFRHPAERMLDLEGAHGQPVATPVVAGGEGGGEAGE
jgi:hypothetical protein